MAYRPAGDEDDFDNDGFYLDGEEIPDDFCETNYTPSFKNDIKPNKNESCIRAPQQNGFGRKLPQKTTYQHNKVPGILLDKFRTAAMRGNIDILDECLKKGIDVNKVLRCGWTALMYASTDSNPYVVQFLLEHGADPNFHKDFYTVLMAACKSTEDEKKVLECVSMLIDKKATVNAEDRYHISPLIYAAREGHTSVVEKLIENGADVNKQDSRGYTALSWATQRKQKGVIKLLLQHGADPALKHTDGLVAKDLALGNTEIISLLEGCSTRDCLSSEITTIVDSQNEMEDSTDSYKQSETCHGEVEVFLYGLDLGSLVPLFQKQHVNFETFLRMTEQDLINMKIAEIGWRKKILDGIQAVHKKDWEATSLLSAQYNKHIGCADAIAMVANISKHLRYIGITVGYINDQIQVHPEILSEVKDGTGPIQFRRHMEDVVTNVDKLSKEVDKLQRRLNVELDGRELDPPDVIQKRRGSKWPKKTLTFLSLTVIGIATLLWKKDLFSKKILFYVGEIPMIAQQYSYDSVK